MNGRQTVLVVDDDRDVRDMLQDYLIGRGYRVVTAADADGMWRALAAAAVDLILLDRTLPDADGLTLIPRIRAVSTAGVILVTALAGDRDRVTGLDGGADDYITKPFLWDELRARMGAVLRRVQRSAAPEPAAATSAAPPSAADEDRRTVTVLCADVAGFVRLMLADEAATIHAWWAYRTGVIEPAVAGHGGRIVKLTGDGFLAEFAEVSAAVACAVAMQRAIGGRNARLPAAQRLVFRMGIDSGSVVAEGTDIYGRTVNLAARLEGAAPPGGICVSAAVRAAARVPGIDFVDLGRRPLKNMDRSVRVFAVRADGIVDPDGAGDDIGDDIGGDIGDDIGGGAVTPAA